MADWGLGTVDFVPILRQSAICNLQSAIGLGGCQQPLRAADIPLAPAGFGHPNRLMGTLLGTREVSQRQEMAPEPVQTPVLALRIPDFCHPFHGPLFLRNRSPDVTDGNQGVTQLE